MNIDLSSFLFRAIFLALPGVIGSKLYRKLKGRPNQKDWEDFLEITLFSLLSYAIYGFIIEVLNRGSLTSFQALFDEKAPLSWREILCASLIGVGLSIAASFVHMRKLINKFGRLIHVTRRYGDEDVWDYFHGFPNVEWVFVRDHKLDLVYFGWILAYSDSEKERELLLRDVEVYSNKTGNLLYRSDTLYLSRQRYDLSIEVPKVGAGGNESAKIEGKEVSRG